MQLSDATLVSEFMLQDAVWSGIAGAYAVFCTMMVGGGFAIGETNARRFKEVGSRSYKLTPGPLPFPFPPAAAGA